MVFSGAHTSAKAADPLNLLLLNKRTPDDRHPVSYRFDLAPI